MKLRKLLFKTSIALLICSIGLMSAWVALGTWSILVGGAIGVLGAGIGYLALWLQWLSYSNDGKV